QICCPNCRRLLQLVETAIDLDCFCPSCGVQFRPGEFGAVSSREIVELPARASKRGTYDQACYANTLPTGAAGKPSIALVDDETSQSIRIGAMRFSLFVF